MKKLGLISSVLLLASSFGVGSAAYAEGDNAAAVYSGYQIYKKFSGRGCATCHGELGSGGGSFPDLKARVTEMSKEDFMKTLNEGTKKGMPKVAGDKSVAKYAKKYGITDKEALEGVYTYLKGVADKTIPAKPPKPE